MCSACVDGNLGKGKHVALLTDRVCARADVQEFGLRQMVLGRFSMGYWTGKIPVLFNLIACVGWASASARCLSNFER